MILGGPPPLEGGCGMDCSVFGRVFPGWGGIGAGRGVWEVVETSVYCLVNGLVMSLGIC